MEVNSTPSHWGQTDNLLNSPLVWRHQKIISQSQYLELCTGQCHSDCKYVRKNSRVISLSQCLKLLRDKSGCHASLALFMSRLETAGWNDFFVTVLQTPWQIRMSYTYLSGFVYVQTGKPHGDFQVTMVTVTAVSRVVRMSHLSGFIYVQESEWG